MSDLLRKIPVNPKQYGGRVLTALALQTSDIRVKLGVQTLDSDEQLKR
ncbi:hypothetical protein [Nostoc sp. 'Peltigera membranacea cyanobiont' 210A]|nr:hypothetical protein [Nostoc sp. 'Peltigera membranacea cyanobiont' 210A]